MTKDMVTASGNALSAYKKPLGPFVDSSFFTPALREYLKGSFLTIKGGVDARVFYPVAAIFSFQRDHGIKGSICEMGVRDGRFYIGLHALKNKGEKTLALDLFDEQIFNVDGSGRRPDDFGLPFFDNVKKYAVDSEDMNSKKTDTLDICTSDAISLVAEFGKFRIVHIDGGHDAEHVINDLRVAEQIAAHGAVVMLDDYYSPMWPGVHEGVAYYYITGRPKLVPFLYSGGKLFLCNYSYHRLYYDFFVKSVCGGAEKDMAVRAVTYTKMYGHRVLDLRVISSP